MGDIFLIIFFTDGIDKVSEKKILTLVVLLVFGQFLDPMTDHLYPAGSHKSLTIIGYPINVF